MARKKAKKAVGNRAPGFTRGKSGSARAIRPAKPIGTREGGNSHVGETKVAKIASGGRPARASVGVPGAAGSASSPGAPTRPASSKVGTTNPAGIIRGSGGQRASSGGGSSTSTAGRPAPKFLGIADKAGGGSRTTSRYAGGNTVSAGSSSAGRIGSIGAGSPSYKGKPIPPTKR